MSRVIKKRAPVLWMLVKVPKITESSRDKTTAELRATLQEFHFGGERATVQRLTKREIQALEQCEADRPRAALPEVQS